MKKIIVSLIFVFGITLNLYALDIVPKASIDLPSTFKTDYEVRVSLGFAAEARIPLGNYFVLGGGFEYLVPRTISTKMAENGIDAYYSGRNFYFLPVYVTVMIYPFENFGAYKPYLKIDGGQNLIFDIDNAVNASAGYYVAGGIGFELFERFIMELTMARYEAEDNGTDLTYKKISFKAGYKFTL